MGKEKTFAKGGPDVWVFARDRKHRIWQTDYIGTPMCKQECQMLDEKSDVAVYCQGCRKIECIRHCNPSSTTQLWRNINKIIPKI